MQVLLEGTGVGGQVAPAQLCLQGQFNISSALLGLVLPVQRCLNPPLCRKPLGAHWKLQSSVHVWQPRTAAECSTSFSFLLYSVFFRIAATLCSVTGARVTGERRNTAGSGSFVFRLHSSLCFSPSLLGNSGLVQCHPGSTFPLLTSGIPWSQ